MSERRFDPFTGRSIVLAPGRRVRGPAAIEETESTIVVGPGAYAVVDQYGNIVIELALRGQ